MKYAISKVTQTWLPTLNHGRVVNDAQLAGDGEDYAEVQKTLSAQSERDGRDFQCIESIVHVPLVWVRLPLKVAFCREELLEAQQKDLFCREVMATVSEETDPQAHPIPEKYGPREAVGIAAGMSSKAGGIAASELKSYLLLDADATLLKYAPGKTQTNVLRP